MLKLYGTIVHYDARLVVLAGCVCLLACYTAFSMMTRLYAPRSRYPWIVAAAVVTGCGAWATHSIALLAFRSGVPVAYDVGTTVIAGVISVVGCGVGFYIARSTERMALGGAIVGFAIGAMQIAGLMAVTFQAHVRWDTIHLQVAILTGMSLGAAALSRAQLTPDIGGRVMGAVFLTAAIGATHLISVAGLTIIPDTSIVIAQDTLGIVWFSIALTAVVFLILGLGIVTNLVDQRFQDMEIAKRDLEAALTLADAANRAKSEFLANMSHELRTPLNAVIGFSEMMSNEVFGALGHQNYKDYAKDIHDSGSHLLQIINDILDLSKAEQGHLRLDESAVNCRKLMVESCRLLGPRLQKGQLALALNFPDALPPLRADARMVKQIMLNLLTNAVKFTPPGGRIEVDVAADPQRGLAITIHDTGIGIDKVDLDRVRQPFVQLDSSLSRHHDGAGLGLPLVDTMTRQHGGTLELHSEPGEGTRARVLFPAERLLWLSLSQDDGFVSGDGETYPDEVPTPIVTAAAKSWDAPHLLVVEDDRDLCDLLQRMLERAGFNTVGASDGREALRHLKAQRIDVLITDIAMPEMDGVELMRILQKEKPDLPIIALSGVEDLMEYHRIAARLGACVALRKPVNHVDLIRAVNDALAARSSNTRMAELAASA